MPIHRAHPKIKMCIGNRKAKEAYQGATKVYSSGNIVTYCVDTGVAYQEEVDDGASCLSPKTFVPTKSGWAFVGWRQDKTASASVLGSLVMKSNPVTLYAVFRQTITLSYSGNGNTGGSTEGQTGYRYYNNENVINPSFTLRENGFTKTDYNFNKWAMGSTSGTQYAAGEIVTLSASTTFYAVWTIQTVVITFVEAGVSTKVTYNKGTTVTRSTAPSGATFVGWSTSANGTNPVSSFVASSNATYYRVVKYADYKIVEQYMDNNSVITPYFAVNVTAYPNLRVTLDLEDISIYLELYKQGASSPFATMGLGEHQPLQTKLFATQSPFAVRCSSEGESYFKVEAVGAQIVG